MTKYDPPFKALFFVCYSTVAAIVATEAGLVGNPDSYAANQSYDAFLFGHEWNLVNEEEHLWCGFGRMDDAEVGYLVPDRDNGVRFINEEEHENLKRHPPNEV